MKAAVINKFGGANVFELQNNILAPEIKQNQVLVKVIATSINPLDCKIRNGELKHIIDSNFPLIIGNDISGIIVKCGENVKRLKVGDQVYGMVDSLEKPSWFGFAKPGAYAEFAATREDTLCIKPEKVSFEEAASIPLCGLTAFQTLVKKVGIKKGNSVLINGASGGVGIFALQIAKICGAKVTAIASEMNRKLLIDLGADKFIDYNQYSIKQLDAKFDIFYDVVANSNYKESKHLLNTSGKYISNIPTPLAAVFPWLRTNKRIRKKTFAWVTPNGTDLNEISKMINNNGLKPIIDTIYSLENIKEAHEHSEKRKVSGKLVVKI